MTYHLAANAVALTHLGFILFVGFGGLLVLRWPRLAWIHLPCAIWGAMIEFAHWYCPLTTIENWLLRKAGQAGYDEGFIAHHLFALIYPGGLTRGLEIALGLFVVALNTAIYYKVFR